jgi:hypothetical protein
MLLAILHIAPDSATSAERTAAWERDGHGVFRVTPAQAPRTAAKEFPPDVVAVELGDRPEDAYPAIRHVLGVPRRRGDRWPIVLLDVRPQDRETAGKMAPGATLLGPGASAAETLAACLEQITSCREEWERGA